ncbi:MAG: ABC transporter ATP-binding protein [Ignavibacteria bacterium]|nr:ABC transporter ATP-binding protein [Ignavibacteria bacterium]
MNYPIEVEGLTKKFQDLTAINNLSFYVKRGEIFGIVGPDGSGKSTLIKLIAGILKPDEGEIRFFDINSFKETKRIKSRIGYLSQNFSHYVDLTVEENLEFFAEVHRVKNFKERFEFLLDFSKLRPFRKTLISNLSGGMKQKLALISSLIYDPELLLLDEPTTGVDPISRREFWLLLNQLVSKGKTIIFATPYLDEAERFHKVLMLNKGEMLCCDTPEKIISSFEYLVAEVVCSNLELSKELLSEFGDVQIFGDRLNLISSKSNPNFLEKAKDKLLKNGIDLISCELINPSLENVFFYLLKNK